MKESIRRSQREHAATLAATVRRTMEQQGGRQSMPAAAPSPEPKRHSLLVAGGILGLVAAVTVAAMVIRQPSFTGTTAADTVATLEVLQGPALAGIGEAGSLILAGTVLDTTTGFDTTTDSRVALRLSSGTAVRLDSDTRLEVASASVLRLERGAVYIDAAAIGTAVEVRTSLGVVRDIGTQFEVRLSGETEEDSALRIRVREGAIEFEGEGNRPAEQAGAGEQLALRGDGTLTRDTISVFGPEWDWVQSLVKIPDTDGRPLAEFLGWASREGGWTLAYVDTATEEMASVEKTYGDVRDLTLKQAMETVLQSSNLESEINNGVFLVRPSGGQGTH